MKEPTITIFIPTYKRPELLANAVKSACQQTYKCIKIVICDNSSNDGTDKVVAKLAAEDSRIHYICHPTNIGMLANYNFALSIVDTDYFSFLSDDDILLPTYCETALRSFLQFPHAGFVACATLSVCKTNGLIIIPVDLWPREGLYQPSEALPELIGKYPVPTTIMFSKKILPKVKIDFENDLAWDCDLLIQIASQFPIAICKEHCGLFIHHAGSFSGSQNPHKLISSIERLVNHLEEMPWIDSSLKRQLKSKLMTTIFDNLNAIILEYLQKKKYSEARSLSRYIFAKYPLHKRTMRFIFISYFPKIHFLTSRQTKPHTPSWLGYENYREIIESLY